MQSTAETKLINQLKTAISESATRELYGSGCSQREWNLRRYSVAYEDNLTTKKRAIPQNPIEEWGFDADQASAKLEEIEKDDSMTGVKTVRRWNKIAKELGNDSFQSLPQCGSLVRKILGSKYPDKVPKKFRIPDNPKEEWGFTAEEAIAKLKELETTHQKPSLAKVAALVGHQEKQGNDDSIPFAKRKDRGLLLKELLKTVDPTIVEPYNKHNNAKSRKRKRRVAARDRTLPIPRDAKRVKETLTASLTDPSVSQQIIGEAIPFHIKIRKKVNISKGKKDFQLVDKIVDRHLIPLRASVSKVLEDAVKANLISFPPTNEIQSIFVRLWVDGTTLGSLPGMRTVNSLINHSYQSTSKPDGLICNIQYVQITVTRNNQYLD